MGIEATPNTCMYLETLHKLTIWEIEACLWWMDMEKDHVLAWERGLRDAMLRDTTPNVIEASFVATLPPQAKDVEYSPLPFIQGGDSFSSRYALSYFAFMS